MLHDRLPPELVSEIFVACLPARDSDRISPVEAPMLLCAVSTTWRKTALSEGRLWDTLVLPGYHRSQHGVFPNLLQQLRFLNGGGAERWFNRTSPDHPLIFGLDGTVYRTFSIRAVQMVLDNLTPMLQPVVDKLGPHRFHTLKLNFWGHSRWVEPAFPFDPPGNRFRELTSLSLSYLRPIFTILTSHPYPRGAPKSKTWHVAFSVAPKLRHLKLSFPINAVPLDFERLVLPWAHQLTSLEVDANLEATIASIPMDDWIEIFRLCRNLIEAKLTAPSDPGDLSQPELDALSHPINSLTLYMDDTRTTNRWAGLTGPIAFPHLLHLHLQFNLHFGRRAPGDKTLFQVLSGAPFCKSLETLSLTSKINHIRPLAGISNHYFVPDDVKELVQELTDDPRAFPSLVHLTIPYQASMVPQRAISELLTATRRDGDTSPLIVTIQLATEEELSSDGQLLVDATDRVLLEVVEL